MLLRRLAVAAICVPLLTDLCFKIFLILPHEMNVRDILHVIIDEWKPRKCWNIERYKATQTICEGKISFGFSTAKGQTLSSPNDKYLINVVYLTVTHYKLPPLVVNGIDSIFGFSTGKLRFVFLLVLHSNCRHLCLLTKIFKLQI